MVDAQDEERPSAPSSPLADPSAEREDETDNNSSNTAGSVQPEDSAVYFDIDGEDVEAFDEARWASLVSDEKNQSETSNDNNINNNDNNSDEQDDTIIMPLPDALVINKEKTESKDQGTRETSALPGKIVISKTVTISKDSQLSPMKKLDDAQATSPETTTTSTSISISTPSTAYRTADDAEISFSSISATSLQNYQTPGAYTIQAPMTDPLREQESTDNIMDSNHDPALITATVVDDTTANSGQTDRVYIVNAQEVQHWDKWRVMLVSTVCVGMLIALMTVIIMVVFFVDRPETPIVDKETSLGSNANINTINITNTTVNNNNNNKNSTPINLQAVYIVGYGSQGTCSIMGDKIMQFICPAGNKAILVAVSGDTWQCANEKNESIMTCSATQFMPPNFAGGPPGGGLFPSPPGAGSSGGGMVAASSSPQNRHLQLYAMAYTRPSISIFACAGNATTNKGGTFVLPPRNITSCTANSNAYGAFRGPTEWLEMQMLCQSNTTGLNASQSATVRFNLQAVLFGCSNGPPLLLSNGKPICYTRSACPALPDYCAFNTTLSECSTCPINTDLLAVNLPTKAIPPYCITPNYTSLLESSDLVFQIALSQLASPEVAEYTIDYVSSNNTQK
jgi:hypothetical protein